MKIFKESDSTIIRTVLTDIPYHYFKKNQEKFTKLMTKLTNEFVMQQLFHGDEIIEYGRVNDIYTGDNHLLFKHSKGVALIRPSSYSFKKENGYKTSINPEINITNSNFINGWSYDTGLFSDVYLLGEYSDFLRFNTRDCLEVHNIYIHWVVSKLEKEFNDFDCSIEVNSMFRNVVELLKITNPILLEFDEYIARNKSKRIDSLVVDGVSVAEYIKTKIQYKYVHSEIDIYKCCMIYGKTHKQVKDYLNKILD